MTRAIVWLMTLAVFIFLAIISWAVFAQGQTHIFMDRKYEILRRGNDVLAVSVDGFVCYGTHEPRETNCHRAIKFREPTALAAPGLQLRKPPIL